MRLPVPGENPVRDFDFSENFSRSLPENVLLLCASSLREPPPSSFRPTSPKTHPFQVNITPLYGLPCEIKN